MTSPGRHGGVGHMVTSMTYNWVDALAGTSSAGHAVRCETGLRCASTYVERPRGNRGTGIRLSRPPNTVLKCTPGQSVDMIRDKLLTTSRASHPWTGFYLQKSFYACADVRVLCTVCSSCSSPKRQPHMGLFSWTGGLSHKECALY